MRPLYEANHNRIAQLNIMLKLLEMKGRGWRVIMSERLRCWDAILQSLEQRRWYEVKVRHRDWNGEHPPILIDGYMISQRKVDWLIKAAGTDPWGLIVDCPDGVYAMTRWRLPDDVCVRKSGRRDRNDPYDWEWCYYIPARYFTRLTDSVTHAKKSADMFSE